MTFSVNLSAEAQRTLRELSKGTDKTAVVETMVKTLGRWGLKTASEISRKVARGDRFAEGRQLKGRTQSLARSIVAGAAAAPKGAPEVRIGIFRGPALAYAGVQEEGTQGINPDSPYPTIKPKPGGDNTTLAIPVNKALTPAGVAKWKSPLDYPGGKDALEFVPILRGKLVGLLVKKLKRPKKTSPASREDVVGNALWLLVRSVDIAPRFYLREGVAHELPALQGLIGDQLQKLLAGRKPV